MMAKDEKTIKDQLIESKLVSSLIEDANALLCRAHKVLAETRSTLEALLIAQHPLVRIEPPYHLRSETGASADKGISPEKAIGLQVRAINALLGDRA